MERKKKFKKMTQENVDQIIAEQKNGSPIEFKNCDVSGLDLSGRKIEWINFEDCNLNGANFSGTVIKQGEFKESLLIGANFEKTDLSKVNFTGCAMQKVNLSQVRIEGVGVKGSNLAHASVKKAFVEFSNLNVFKDVNLMDADLSESQINWFYGENINFEGTNFDDTIITESQIKGCNFVNASLENAELYSVVFADCEMQKSVLAKAKITNVTFEKSMMENANFKQSEIEFGNFVDSNLDGADFREVTLSSLNEFRNVSLIAADFSKATFSEDSKLHDANLVDVKGLPDSYHRRSIIEEYQYHLNLFITTYIGSEVNAEVDCKIATALLEEGHSSQSIESVIALHSPNIPKESSQAQVYAMNILKKAKKERRR